MVFQALQGRGRVWHTLQHAQGHDHVESIFRLGGRIKLLLGSVDRQGDPWADHDLAPARQQGLPQGAGALTQVGSVSTGVNAPLQIAVQSNTNGNLVYSFGIADSALAFNAAEGYALNSSGTLTAVVGSPFSNAEVGDLGQFDQSGAFLFIYGGIFNINTNTTTFQMGAFDVASNGDLTQPTSTLTLPAGGFWVATDPQ